MLESVVVDALDCGFPRLRLQSGPLREGVADPGDSCDDFSGHLLIEAYQLGGALADVVGEGLRLGLPRNALRGRSTGGAVGDRCIFTDIESGGMGVLDRMSHPRAGRIQV